MIGKLGYFTSNRLLGKKHTRYEDAFVFSEEFLLDNHAIEGDLDIGGIDFEEVGGLLDCEGFGEIGVALVGGVAEDMEEAAGDAFVRGWGDAVGLGDAIGSFEADSFDIVAEEIGIRFDDFERCHFIFMIDFGCHEGRDAVFLQEHDDITSADLGHITFADSEGFFECDAFDV